MLKSKTPHNFVLGTFAEGNYLLPWRPNCEASDLLPDLPTLSQVRFPNIIIIITIVIGTTTIMPNLPEASFPNSVTIAPFYPHHLYFWLPEVESCESSQKSRSINVSAIPLFEKKNLPK